MASLCALALIACGDASGTAGLPEDAGARVSREDRDAANAVEEQGKDAGEGQGDAGAPADAADASATEAPDLDAGSAPARAEDAAVRDGQASPDAAAGDAREPLDASDRAPGACLLGHTKLTEEGPFAFTSMRVDRVEVRVPDVPDGCRVPVVHFANGTGARCSNYEEVLTRLASHGFLAACLESTSAHFGEDILAALEVAMQEFPALVDTRIGSVGHHTGGQGALLGLGLAEAHFGPAYTYAGLAVQPASGATDQPAGSTWQERYAAIRSPVFLFSGTADILVSEGWVQRAFDALDDGIEAYFWSAEGATHIPVPQQETAEVAVPWFRWKLLGDAEACEVFQGLRDGPRWERKASQNEEVCR